MQALQAFSKNFWEDMAIGFTYQPSFWNKARLVWGPSRRTHAWLLVVTLCAGCSVAPVEETRSFSKAFAAVDGASQPLLDDLASAERRQGRENAEKKAKSDAGVVGGLNGQEWMPPPVSLKDFASRMHLGLNRMPWALIGVIHAMECGFNFATHLHNGDPLTNRTKHVPAGQPQTGTPPFSWESSAIDALTHEGFNTVTDWSIPHMLYLLEKYNGFGYRKMGKPSPYLWSFSNLYEKGKYVADGRFDPQTVPYRSSAALLSW
jgi:lysozyme family protein